MRDLLDLQQRLRSGADSIVAELALDELLGRIGRPVRVGSSAMALMVRPDSAK